ncbi:rod-binding protein [Oryzibacter oryziterrae]|uniref:rod-binding protein n=1 Tax=Oryzibacter oryziterrae TaxID=2766474 RepID=UPI001F345BA0|nr:rod-binding protein [Oryzibacter oryziterrae]
MADASLSGLTAAFASKAYSNLSASDLHKRAMGAAQDFEAVYVADAFKDMFKNVSVDPLSDTSNSSNETWRDMMIDGYAKDLVKRGGIGIADSIARELIAIQEGRQHS